MKQVKQLDFSGQTIYCGVDVHKKSWKVSIRNKEMELRSFSQPPEAEVLYHFLKANYPSANYKAVYEAGFCGFGHQRKLRSLGINCIIVHPADVPTMDKERQNKTDSIDCHKLGRGLSEGSLQGIYIPEVQLQDDRCLVRSRGQFVRDQTRYKNRIKSFLDFQGICMSERMKTSRWSARYVSDLKDLPMATDSSRKALDLLIQGYEQARKQVLFTTRQIREMSKQQRYNKKLTFIKSVNGIGFINAMLFLTELGDIKRFKNLDKLCSYVGLTPLVHGSGDHETIKGLTYRGHASLRDALIESSWSAIRVDPALTVAFTNYCKRMPKNKAIVKIARKLLNRIRYVLINEKEYVPGVVE